MKDLTEIVVIDEAELNNLAKELIQFAKGNTLWAFYGEMGAGKTTFIRYICKNLGINENVSSPTFSIVNEYNDLKGNKVFHFDFYRIKNEQEAVDIGCGEYFQSNSLCLIEWPEKILNLLPHPHIKIEIKTEPQKHTFTFSYE